MTHIKICGITNKPDAIAAADLHVDMLGFVFYPGSKRCVDHRGAEDIANELPAYIAKVGVFVDEDIEKVREIAENVQLDILQLHGKETPEYCKALGADYKIIKAFRIIDISSLKDVNNYDADFYMFDNHAGDMSGGTGRVFDWKLLDDFEALKPVIISGGLNPDNVGKAIGRIAPYGVDVSSGVESAPGKKDIDLMKRFVAAVRKAG